MTVSTRFPIVLRHLNIYVSIENMRKYQKTYLFTTKNEQCAKPLNDSISNYNFLNRSLLFHRVPCREVQVSKDKTGEEGNKILYLAR